MTPVQDIITAAARLTYMPQDVITGDGREKYIVRVRQAIYHIACAEGHSFKYTGRCMGGRDHSTVRHGADQATIHIERSKGFRMLVDEVRAEAVRVADKRRSDMREAFAGMAA